MVWMTTAAMAAMLWLATPTASTDPATKVDVPRDVHVLLTAPDRHVRAAHPRFNAILAEGVRRSQTFANLIASLNDTDVIVYVDQAHGLQRGVDGRTQLVPIVHYQRYLRIQVRVDLPRDHIIAIVGHELTHALEIATAADVRDDAAVERLYKRIGIPGQGTHAFDTVAAQRTGRQVQLELAG